jgi:hypothetical protein
MANHRIYQYTSIGRPLDPAYPTNRAVLILMPLGALLGAVVAWFDGAGIPQVFQQAVVFALILFVSWALARELDPDDNPAAFISLACGLLVALAVESPGVLIAFVTLGLVRIVNRSSGLAARKADSVVVMVLSIAVIYATQSPLFGAVAALAFMLDGSLKDPLRHQWLFGLLCLGGTIVYMVDHDIGPGHLNAPDSLFEWLALLFLLIFALNTALTRKVHSKGDIGSRRLDVNRVRGGMAVGLFAALQGIQATAGVAVIVAVIAGICIGMAFRKGFKAPRINTGKRT